MPARSKAQQRLFGMALHAKRTGEGSAKIKEIADSMTAQQLRDFARTRTTGLPEKKANEEALEVTMEDVLRLRAARDAALKKQHGLLGAGAGAMAGYAGGKLPGAAIGGLAGLLLGRQYAGDTLKTQMANAELTAAKRKVKHAFTVLR